MFSVIIPTIWKSKEITNLIDDLNKNNNVTEIILIDNSPKENFLTSDLLNVKTKVFKFENNMYVNPSWNFGVLKSNEDNIVLCNDDITFNSFIFNVLNVEDETLFGIDSSCYNLEKDSSLQIKDIKTRCYGYGCLMFFKKKFFKQIPEQLKIWYGDDFLFKIFKNKKCISGLKINTKMSSSSELPEFKNLILSDIRNWNNLNLEYV